jgi:hypothetical protein
MINVGKQLLAPREATKSRFLSCKMQRTVSSRSFRPFRRHHLRRLAWGLAWYVTFAVLFFHGSESRAEDLAVEVVSLPPLRIEGKPAKAHIQGLELAGGKYYMTARREDVRPRKALLLRTDAAATGWDTWDITPLDAQGASTGLDHPGGMQSDGTRLWIPVAESRRNSRAIIRAYLLADLEAGRRLKPAFEFPVSDHIGAVAVSIRQGVLLGANWDTEKVYVWDLKGQLQQVLSSDGLEARGLGVVAGPEGRAGIAVQDWKLVDDRLYASGLFGASKLAVVSPASRICWFDHFLGDSRRQTVPMPRRDGIELCREAMAISGDGAYFLPEDLGATNRLFRVALAELVKRSTAEQLRPSKSADR